MLKLYKILFFNSMTMGTLMAISAHSWLGMWMGLEINLLSIIPLMSSSKNMLSSEASLKYFITQAMASLILLLSVTLMMITSEFITPMVNSTFTALLNTALLTKLGAAPFHYWFPEVMEGLNWFNCTVLLTWQKIAPMALLMNQIQITLFISVIVLSLLISTLMSLNQTSLRKIMAFSSINHIAWMISALLISPSVWLIYLVIYLIITVSITLVFSFNKLFIINQLTSIFNMNKTLKFSLMSNFLSLGGLPPFLGFLPKWLTINWMVLNNFHTIAIILILTTLIMLFIYVRILTTALILSHSEPKIMPSKGHPFPTFLINFLTITSLASCTLICNFF
uniref:NADH dehydrogenase subunit 2 n=1 Tax=Lagorina sericea TaxID=2908302 RepID=UPI001FA720ED|nr:NADH dehydrogenase subunit 2 [Lagorina sericea]UMR54886.1 NADH dehydrogenase subunit 2 [Lagorina sericea]